MPICMSLILLIGVLGDFESIIRKPQESITVNNVVWKNGKANPFPWRFIT